MARSAGSAFVSGDANGKPTGFLSLETDAAADFTRPWGKLQHVMSGYATTITADALVAMSLSLRVPYRTNATWIT